jgi:outer membrane protein TolC
VYCFELGVAGSLEFRDAQVNFERAQTTLIVARYQARIAQLEIEQLIGAIQLD